MIRMGMHAGAPATFTATGERIGKHYGIGFRMKLVVREKGSRRVELPARFPLIDSQGVLVASDRRQLPDRRKQQYGIDDLKVILSKMSSD